MKSLMARTILVAVTAALAAVLSGQADAACGSSQRVSHDDVDCLDAEWHNKPLGRATVKARNLCSNLGKVVAKVDRKIGSDYTWHLSSGDWRDEKASHYHVRGVYCCKDLSDLCDSSELPDPGCTEKFRSSKASQTCFEPQVTFVGPDACQVSAWCQNAGWTGQSYAEALVPYSRVDELKNCGGFMQLGDCDCVDELGIGEPCP